MSMRVPPIRFYDYKGRSSQAPSSNVNLNDIHTRSTLFGGEGFTLFPSGHQNTPPVEAITFNPGQTLRDSGMLTQNRFEDLNTFNKSLHFDPSQYGTNTGYSAGGLTTTPQTGNGGISDKFNAFIGGLNISDEKINELLKQPSFEIFGRGMSMKVTTDGNGHIESVRIAPHTGKNPFGQPVSQNFTTVEQLAKQRMLKAPQPVVPTDDDAPPPVTPDNSVQEAQNVDQTQDNNIQLPQTNPNDATTSPGLTPLTEPSLPDADNPALAKLIALQPSDSGTQVVGTNAQISPETSKQVATALSDYKVEFSDDFQKTLSQYKQNLAAINTQQQQANPTSRMDGKMPLSPTAPSEQTMQNSPLFASNSNSMEQSMSSSTSTDKRSAAGAYVPQHRTHTGSEYGNGGGGGGGGGGGFNASTGGGQGRRQQRGQQPFRILA